MPENQPQQPIAALPLDAINAAIEILQLCPAHLANRAIKILQGAQLLQPAPLPQQEPQQPGPAATVPVN